MKARILHRPTESGEQSQSVEADNVTANQARQSAPDHDTGDAGISLASVLVMLAVLAVLVVGIFWALPAWFGSQVIEVTIRN